MLLHAYARALMCGSVSVCAQALSIRPDLLSPAAMNELQKLCDKVPSFPTPIAMQVRHLTNSQTHAHRADFTVST